VCIVVPGQRECTWLATTSTPTSTPGTPCALPRADLPPRRRARRSSGDLLGAAQLPRRLDHQLCRGHSRGSDPANELPTPLVWIEHWPKESSDGGAETFELVVFSSYKVEERAPYLGKTRAWIGDATWKTLDRTSVAILVGGEV
jgi:hypothetical protein